MKPTNIETLGEVIFDLSDIKSALLRTIKEADDVKHLIDDVKIQIAELQFIWWKLHKIYEQEYFELNENNNGN